jgi:uncharacterized metal-binding protein YceD (DUF177 family)
MGADETEIPEEEDDVVFISRADIVIDVSVWIYEFLMLSVPPSPAWCIRMGYHSTLQ